MILMDKRGLNDLECVTFGLIFDFLGGLDLFVDKVDVTFGSEVLSTLTGTHYCI